MTDRPKDAAPKTSAESPIARALRLKQAALKTKPQPPGGGGKTGPRPTAGMAAGASKPALKR